MIAYLSSLQDNLAFIIFAQGVGLLGVAIDFYAANQKCDTRLKRLTAINSFLFSFHFGLIMAFSAAISDFITGIRYWLSDSYNKAWIGIGFILFYLISAFFIVEQFWDTLPFFASVVGTLAIYYFNGIKMRLAFIIGQIAWLIYSAVVFSLGGLLTYSILLVMTSKTIYSLHKEKQVV